nr:GAF and ANTAR domain-containing protein [Kineococcus aurantiacus]
MAHRLVHHTADLVSASAVGFLVEDAAGRLSLLAASSSEAVVVELFQLQNDEGPCLDCYRDATPTAASTAAELTARWPRFAAKAISQGIVSVHTLPVQVLGRTVGALNLFRDREGPFSAVETDVAHAMASFGAVGIGQLVAGAEGDRLRDQLQEALDSRVVLEQAKGVLAERHRVHPDDAFTQLRTRARAQRRRLRDVASEVVAQLGEVPAGQA